MLKTKDKSSLKKCKLKVYKLHLSRKNFKNYNINEDWLRGFIEAEGCFSQNRGNPMFTLTQIACEWPLFEAIKKKMDCGRLHLDKRKNGTSTVVYTLSGKKVIRDKLLPILRPGFVFSKVGRVYRLWVETHFPDLLPPKINISWPSINAFNLQWLHGFCDGDGSFYFVLRKQIDYISSYQVQANHDLCQRVPLDELKQFGQHVHKFGDCKFWVFILGGVAHLRVSALGSCEWLCDKVFKEHKFRSRKVIDFIFWRFGLKLMRAGHHLRVGGPSTFKRLQALQKYYRAH